MDATNHCLAWKTLLAFAIIYFVWGSTFLAIRAGVCEVPPFLLAATAGATALIIASISWPVTSALTRKLQLPPSKVMSSGAQMFAGGALLAFTAAVLGEFRRFHPSTVSRGAWLALLYLIVAGSIIAFTAYVWLIHHESPTKVGTYAYVNPVVAVFLGCFLGGETLDLRTVLGNSVRLGQRIGHHDDTSAETSRQTRSTERELTVSPGACVLPPFFSGMAGF